MLEEQMLLINGLPTKSITLIVTGVVTTKSSFVALVLYPPVASKDRIYPGRL